MFCLYVTLLSFFRATNTRFIYLIEYTPHLLHHFFLVFDESSLDLSNKLAKACYVVHGCLDLNQNLRISPFIGHLPLCVVWLIVNDHVSNKVSTLVHFRLLKKNSKTGTVRIIIRHSSLSLQQLND